MAAPAQYRLESDSFVLIAPAMSAGARALRDPTAYLLALSAALLTLVPAGLLVVTAIWGVGIDAPLLTALMSFLAYLLGIFGVFWIWMTLGVRAASVERGEPSDVATTLRSGARRLLTFVGAGLLFVLAGVPLLILAGVTWVLASQVVLSVLAIPLALVLVVGLFVWLLALVLVGSTLGAFAAADHRVGAVTVLVRSVGASITNPAGVALLVIAVGFVALLMVGLLAGPGSLSLSAGFGFAAYMFASGRGASGGLLSLGLVLGSGALLLVPLLFVTSALASFAVSVEGELARIEETGRRAGSALLERIRTARTRFAASRRPGEGPDDPPAGGAPPDSGPPPAGGPPQGPNQPHQPPAAVSASPHDAPVTERPPAGAVEVSPSNATKPMANADVDDDIDLGALPPPDPGQGRESQ